MKKIIQSFLIQNIEKFSQRTFVPKRNQKLKAIFIILKYSIFASLIILLVYTTILFIFINEKIFGFIFIWSTRFGFGLKYGELGYSVAFRICQK
jgi:hypothetical protein